MSEERDISPDSPWLGLRSFTEEARGYFFGRDAELNDLYERVVHRPLTIFFGQSGLGKTSLLRAGLVPRLRETGFVPVPLRLDWVAGNAPPEDQVLTAVREALRATRNPRWQELAAFPANLSLWRLLHDRTHGFVPAPNDPQVPRIVLLFDQFEEIFTLGQRKRVWVDQWRDTLAALVENRPPPELRNEFRENAAMLGDLDLRARPAKVVLTLRHDFLHLVERWRRHMPSLLDNRLELRHLNGPQALQAVLLPGRLRTNKPPIIDTATGRAIVRFVAGAPNDKPLKEIETVPPLLSLVCAELNKQRRQRDLERVVFDPFADEPLAVREYLEQLPLTADGHRDPIPRGIVQHELLSRGLSSDDIDSSLTSLTTKGVVSVSSGTEGESITVSPGFLEFGSRSGDEILQVFYDSCFADLADDVRVWLEDTFLSPEGFRQTVNIDTAISSLSGRNHSDEDSATTLDVLVARRILTAVEYGEVRRLELTHDILAPVVRKSRDARRAREADEATRRRRQEADEAARAQELYALSTRGLRPQPLSDSTPRGARVKNLLPDSPEWGKRLNLSDYFWDDLLTYVDEGTVIPVVGKDLVTVMVGDRLVPLERLIAESVAQSLRLNVEPSAAGLSLNDVARSCVRSGLPRERIYRHVLAAANDFKSGLELSPALRKIAEITPFRLFVSLTFDSQLASAIFSVRRQPAAEVAYTPRDPRDLPANYQASSETVVYQLLGRLSATPDFVVSDEDLLEFFYTLQDGTRQPSLLLDELRKSHLLMLGCALPDWLARIFIRMTQGGRLSAPDHRIVVVDSHPDESFEVFTSDFRRNTQVIPSTPNEFIDEFVERWQARRPVEATYSRDAVSMRQGSVYLSYAAEDRDLADRLTHDLEEAGITVWLSSYSLEPGEVTDERIRRNIADCACFMPIVSRSTDSNRHATFRREWGWASERALGLSDSVQFILPVIADDMRMERAGVPDSFRRVQEIRLAEGHLPPEVVDLVRRLVRDYHRRRQLSSY